MAEEKNRVVDLPVSPEPRGEPFPHCERKHADEAIS